MQCIRTETKERRSDLRMGGREAAERFLSAHLSALARSGGRLSGVLCSPVTDRLDDVLASQSERCASEQPPTVALHNGTKQSARANGRPDLH